MPEPAKRSRSMKRIKKRTPSGRNVIHYRRRNPNPPKCSRCGAILSGIPRLRPNIFKKLPKTQRKVNRPYGGYLCPSCLKYLAKNNVQGEPPEF